MESNLGESEKKRKRTRSSEDDLAAKKMKVLEDDSLHPREVDIILPSPGLSTELALLEPLTTHKDTINPQQQSPLAKLPVELRQLVYGYVFPQHDLFMGLEHCKADVKDLLVAQPNLTRTCRLLQAEALPFFYSKHEPIVTVNHYRQTHYFWDGRAPGYHAPWIDEMNNPDVRQIKTVLFLCRTTRDRAYLDDEKCLEDVLFRASFDHPEPGVKIQYKIWHEETSAHLPLWRDSADPDKDKLHKTNVIFAEAGLLEMSRYGLCQNDTAFERRNIKAFAELLLSLPRWPIHD